MAKTNPLTETMSERIAYLFELTNGRMPMTIVVKTDAEFNDAASILKKRKITNLTVRVETR